ncbi:response regulator [Ferruginibacter yonginensis]|uniref:Response regulator n=1 Tax=Ferruginibacter yonginensis TaxID=1310416 RepID=A0ABV8QPP8_9BACT
MIRVGIVDDHQLFVKSLSLMLATFKDVEVSIEANSGADLQQQLHPNTLPDIILLDVNMPIMNGVETAKWVTANFPTIKLVALSMNNDDNDIINMIKAGCCAYLLKDTHPNELEKALIDIHQKGFYHSDMSNINFRRILQIQQQASIQLTERELQFLQYACSDLTYKNIASLMNVSESRVDAYRERLFEKLQVQSRVGLCLEAVRKKLISL